MYRITLGTPQVPVDIVFLVDQSSSMITEHEWLNDIDGDGSEEEGVVQWLHNELTDDDKWNIDAANIRYGLIGFGGPQ